MCCLFCIEFSQALLMPYERFVMLLKSRSHTHHHISTTPTLGVGAKTCFPSRSTKKCSTPTLGVNTKTCLRDFSIHQINAPSSCCYLSKVLLQEKRHGAMQKLFIKKREKSIGKKWTSVRIIKTMGT